jgi:hypothetical protein
MFSDITPSNMGCILTLPHWIVQKYIKFSILDISKRRIRDTIPCSLVFQALSRVGFELMDYLSAIQILQENWNLSLCINQMKGTLIKVSLYTKTLMQALYNLLKYVANNHINLWKNNFSNLQHSRIGAFFPSTFFKLRNLIIIEINFIKLYTLIN